MIEQDFRRAMDELRDRPPRCWDTEAREFRHLVSPRDLAQLRAGEIPFAVCLVCGHTVRA